MSTSASSVRLGPLTLRRSGAGTLCCIISMLGYSAANACLRKLSIWQCDSAWVICNKELITVAVVGPWLLWQAIRRRSGFPTGRPLAILVAVGLATELIGNLGIQWGYSIVGLAVMIPANNGFVLVSTAILGGIFLGERVSARNLAAVALLIGAVALLGVGAAQAAPADHVVLPASRLLIAAAIAAAAAAGIVFALLAISIRHCVRGATSQGAVVVIITGMGVLTLGPISFFHVGAETLLATTWQQYVLMFTAGFCNLLAFLALVRGLKFTTALHANTINAGQVALAAITGVLFFDELTNPWLALGAGLTIAGIFAFGSPIDREAIDAHV